MSRNAATQPPETSTQVHSSTRYATPSPQKIAPKNSAKGLSSCRGTGNLRVRDVRDGRHAGRSRRPRGARHDRDACDVDRSRADARVEHERSASRSPGVHDVLLARAARPRVATEDRDGADTRVTVHHKSHVTRDAHDETADAHGRGHLGAAPGEYPASEIKLQPSDRDPVVRV